jgi:hypothetical protein
MEVLISFGWLRESTIALLLKDMVPRPLGSGNYNHIPATFDPKAVYHDN